MQDDAAADAAAGPDAGTDPASGDADHGEPSHLPTSLLPTAFAALVAVALTAAAFAGDIPLLVAVAGVQALFVAAWVFGTGLPGRIGALLTGAGTAGAADAVVMAWPGSQLGPLLAVAGLAVPAMFIHQLSRGVVRTRVVESVSDIAVIVLGTVALAALIQTRHEFETLMPLEEGTPNPGRVVAAVVLAAAGAIVVANLVDLVAPVPRFDPAVPRGLLGLVGATVAGMALGYLLVGGTSELSGARAAYLGGAIGAVAGLLAVASSFVVHGLAPASSTWTGRARVAAQVLLPVALCAPLGFLVAVVVRG